jgi:hypothetical protein
MDFMIRIIIAILLLSSCGNLPIAYLQNFSSVNNVVFGFPEYEITQEIYEEFENSFLKIRFGRGPHAILILAYVDNDIYEWVGADDVSIFTKNGRIIKTSGLVHNFEVIKPLEKLYTSNEVYESINLLNPDLFSATLKHSISTDEKKLTKLGSTINVNRIKDNISLDIIGWKKQDVYYQNSVTQQIEAIEQHIHPELPAVKVEYYLKF